MINYRIFFSSCGVILMLSGYVPMLSAQVVEDLDFIMKSLESSKKQEVKDRDDRELMTNELSTASVALIRVYQRLISSQDKPSCNFIPSCSQFGIEAVRECGIIRGGLLTFDRLQRCNGFGMSYYAIDGTTGLALDPLAIYTD